jgi:hypothetical protein
MTVLYTDLQQKIEKEITAGRVEGPLQKPHLDNFRVSRGFKVGPVPGTFTRYMGF